MSYQKTVTVIGGGIAGLSASVFLTEKGFKVTLVEASPKLGGRAYSFLDKDRNQFFDNGQHILAGWYKNTFEYLRIIGSFSKLNFQKNLEINFIDTGKNVYKLKCPDSAPPLNLLIGLLKFNALDIKDKFALKNIYNVLKSNNNYDDSYESVRDLLEGLKQTSRLVKYFWEPFVLAVFNTQPKNVNVRIFLNIIRNGFNKKESSVLVIPDVNLNELLIDDARKYFKRKNVVHILDKRVKNISIGESVNEVVFDDGSKSNSDYYISAVPFFAFKHLFEEKIYIKNKFRSEFLKASSIVSVHIFFEEKIPEDLIPDNSFGMTGLIGTIVQWIFKRSDRHLSLIISGADNLQIREMSNEDIIKLCFQDLNKTLKKFNELKISGYKIIKEKRATFIPDNTSNEFRPSQETQYGNFFIAGDWTNTGLPATIESAVLSSKICVESILRREMKN